MSVTKEEIDKYLKKVKIGDRGYFNKENERDRERSGRRSILF